MEHPIEALMRTTMDNLKQMIDVNTIVGDAVETKDGTVIIPISKVSIGFASGGTEFKGSDSKGDGNNKLPFGGGSGAGVSLQPVAFLVVKSDLVRLLPVAQSGSIERIIDNIPEFVEEITALFKKDKEKEKPQEENSAFNAT
ncbi:MAG: GerW family sporulation protein [Caloramator sp.]|nr:GerW family sporulation protein [Caloramator sp.]